MAAPSTNDSGGAAGEPKRTSSRNWGQHWQDLDRDYFRPVSAADIENLRIQVWWLDGGCWMAARKCACMACAMGPDRLPPSPHTAPKRGTNDGRVRGLLSLQDAGRLFVKRGKTDSKREGATARSQTRGTGPSPQVPGGGRGGGCQLCAISSGHPTTIAMPALRQLSIHVVLLRQ